MSIIRFIVLFVSFSAFLSGFNFVCANELIELEKFAEGMTKPVYITHAADGGGRVFIVEKGGSILTHKAGSLLDKPFLDISDRVFSRWETGLLSVAFHPDYIDNGRFFVYYTAKTDDDVRSVVSEFRVSDDDPDVAATDERIVMEIDQPTDIHNGGQLQFGPDGYLYISLGDGGPGDDPSDNAQNKDVLLGSILRIDIDGDEPYSIPDDNPFVGEDGADEIWAYGFRNPWRFSFDRESDRLFVGDVGQARVEEVDLVEKGGNYGWRILEGSVCRSSNPAECIQDGLIMPINEYVHSDDLGKSITGGYVYRGADTPNLFGSYVFGDFSTSRIWALSETVAGEWIRTELLSTEFAISSFGEDEHGELYFADHDGGSVYKIIGADPLDSETPEPTPGETPTETPTETPATGSDNEFTVNCENQFSTNLGGFGKLQLSLGQENMCVLRLANMEPGKQVRVELKIRKGLRASVDINHMSGMTNEEGVFQCVLTAVRKGVDWIVWAVPDEDGEIRFDKKAIRNGSALGMFVKVR